MKSFEEILDRAFIILMLSESAWLERPYPWIAFSPSALREERRRSYVEVLSTKKLLDCASNEESSFLTTSVGGRDLKTAEGHLWNYEALRPLLWATGLSTFPSYKAKFEDPDLHKILAPYKGPKWDADSIQTQPEKDIVFMRKVAWLWNWRVREAVFRPGITVDFPEAIPRIFGESSGVYLGKVPLEFERGGNFLVDRLPISMIGNEPLAILERQCDLRHHSLEWVLNDETWEKTYTDA